MNADKAIPSIEIECKDRVRRLCFDSLALCRLEEYLAGETGNEDYSIISDFDWTKTTTIRTLSLLAWAALQSDADEHGEVLTVEKARSVLDLASIAQSQAVILEAMERAFPNEQDKIAEAQKKIRKGTSLVVTSPKGRGRKPKSTG